MRNLDYQPFGAFQREQFAPAEPSTARFPTGQVTRCRKSPDASTPVDVALRNDLRQYDQAKVHGAKAALTFVADETRAGEPTVTIESAARGDSGEHTYIWNEKLRFQLTRIELQLLTCLLLGGIDELMFRNHGGKWCGISRQRAARYAGTIRLTMGQSDPTQFAPRSVAIDHTTLGAVTSLCLRQCARLLRLPVEATPTVLGAVSRAYTDQIRSGAGVDRRTSPQDSMQARATTNNPPK
jgi:hypothetical protein